MTDFDIIREALFLVTRETHNSALAALDHLRAVLAERATEIERLRGMALDLSKVPDGYAWSICTMPSGQIMAIVGGWGKIFEAIAPTPATALNAAIERAKTQR